MGEFLAGCLGIVIGLALLFVFYWFEDWRSRRRFKERIGEIQARYPHRPPRP